MLKTVICMAFRIDGMVVAKKAYDLSPQMSTRYLLKNIRPMMMPITVKMMHTEMITPNNILKNLLIEEKNSSHSSVYGLLQISPKKVGLSTSSSIKSV